VILAKSPQKCYLCDSAGLEPVDGSCRDKPDLLISRCSNCRLVFLDNFDHIIEGFYEGSNMNSEECYGSLERWRESTNRDDKRRYESLKDSLFDKDIMDFGSGNAGFLKMAGQKAKSIVGVEIDRGTHEIYENDKIPLHTDIRDIPSTLKFDIITAFHVIEHLKDPIAWLKELSCVLKKAGKIVLEFPNSEDCLLSLYKSGEFSNFTYWSCHLMLYNQNNIKTLIEKAGLECVKVEQIQRYPLSNHLYWLSHGKPNGHNEWPGLNSQKINKEYEALLSQMGMCDTIVVEVANKQPRSYQ